jgi:hypothetical protein
MTGSGARAVAGRQGVVTEERTNPEQDDVTLAEIEVESDVMDADVEGLAPAPERPSAPPSEPGPDRPELDELDLAEAEVETDVMDADIEGR